MSIKSMTGFGSGNARVNDYAVTAEISSVNRKQLEIRLTLPRDFAPFENDLRKLVQQTLSRGMISVRLVKTAGARELTDINVDRAKALAASAKALAAELGIPDTLNIADLLRMPGVLDDNSVTAVSEDCKSAAMQALQLALNALDQMRQTEGGALAEELLQRLQTLEGLREKLLPEVSNIEQQLRQRLLDKLSQSNLPVDTNDERFLKELLYYADKADVTEELTRLSSHFQQFRGFLSETPGGGRSMDFLVQEMFREITTLGNKAGSGPVAAIVVQFKSELEKIREQIQNIE